MKDIALAVAIRDLASVTTIAKVSSALKEVGELVTKQASGRVFDEYCGTAVKPRVPVPRPRYATGGFSATVIAADFNGDGILDLATGNYYDANIAILLGNGDGTFGAHVNYPAAAGARGLVAADFNGDGRLDLAVANQFVDSISVFLQPVLDTTPPAITVGVNPKTLWPPNGKMVPVTVSGTITDTGSGVNVTSAAYSVTDEYGEVEPAGAITLGAGGSYSFTVLLQASRLGTDLDGRHYTITVRASDNSGNSGSQASGVTVPHDQRD